MPEFRRITLADKEWIDPLLRMGNLRGSEYTFTNNFIYRAIYHIEVARMNDYYLVRSHREEGDYSYLYPAGSGDLRPVVDALAADAAELGVPFRMNGVPREGTAALEALFPGRFAFAETRDHFDYLYESEKLITLSGKKLHGKRNFVNRFLAENEGRWAYEAITPENLPECWRMNVAWCAENGCGEDPSLAEETCAVKNCFDHFTALGLQGHLF